MKIKKNVLALVLANVLLMVCSTLVTAEEVVNPHWYLGLSGGLLKPDNNHQAGGNIKNIGLQGGYQFNNDWAVELDYIVDAGNSGKADMNSQQLDIIRSWGTDLRFLALFGVSQYEFSNVRAGGDDGSERGVHVGVGVSTFFDSNWELRAELKVGYFGADSNSDFLFFGNNDETNTEGYGALSLNYHFGRTVTRSLSRTKPAAQPAPPRQQPAPLMQSPKPVVVVEPVPRVKYTLINFTHDSDVVESQYNTQLDEISQEIIQTDSRATIEGYTDSTGSAQYNQYLSEDRAIQVKKDLKARGVNGEDLTTVGYGEDRPVADNSTAEGRVQNRRVEVKVFDQ